MLSFISETLHSRKKLFLSATTMTILLKICTLSPALLLGRIIDDLSLEGGMTPSNITALLGVLCAAVVLQSTLHPVHTYQLVKLVQSTLADMSTHWSRTILGKEFEQFSSLRIGGLIKSVERGITAHEKFLTFFITSGFPLIIELALIAGIFGWLGGAGIFTALLVLSLGYMLLFHRLIGWRRPYLVAVNNQEDSMSSTLFETFQAGKSIKLEQADGFAISALRQRYVDYAHAATRVASTGAVLGSVKILYIGLTTAGLLAWGVNDQASMSPRLSVGELVAVFSLAGLFVGNFSALAEAYRALDQFLVDKKKLHETLLLKDLIKPPQTPLPHPLSILGLPAIAQVTNQPLSFRADQSVAIVGPSGAGKSTLLEALAGALRRLRRGISLNGAQMRSSDIQMYLGLVRYCPQHPIFLEGTFEHSVLFGQAVSADLAHAIDALGLTELVAHRRISEGAKNISGGEAKRLSLLRLINRPGDYNLFDEPTSALDQKAAKQVWTVLFQYFQNRGLICATHDLAVLPRFDRVIVIAHGRIIADGRWCELENDSAVAPILAQIIHPWDIH